MFRETYEAQQIGLFLVELGFLSIDFSASLFIAHGKNKQKQNTT
jgi:hypothetical protein